MERGYLPIKDTFIRSLYTFADRRGSKMDESMEGRDVRKNAIRLDPCVPIFIFSVSFSISQLCVLKADRNLRSGWPLPPADSIKKKKNEGDSSWRKSNSFNLYSQPEIAIPAIHFSIIFLFFRIDL